MYNLVKYNNGKWHVLESHDNKDVAIKQAKALHHPDWPCWQGIMVYDGCKEPAVCVFDTND